MKKLHSFLHPDGSRRVDIIQRWDGTFGFKESLFSAEEQAWFPLTYRRSTPILDSAETAIKEAKDRIDWLRNIPTP